jgi:hypothetical protein
MGHMVWQLVGSFALNVTYTTYVVANPFAILVCNFNFYKKKFSMPQIEILGKDK